MVSLSCIELGISKNYSGMVHVHDMVHLDTFHELFPPRGKGLEPQHCAPHSKAKRRLAHPPAGEWHKKKAKKETQKTFGG